jgi:hypothetical protein
LNVDGRLADDKIITKQNHLQVQITNLIAVCKLCGVGFPKDSREFSGSPWGRYAPAWQNWHFHLPGSTEEKLKS